jgi:arylsulfatase A-like enzyme
MKRRDFLKVASLIAVAIALGACSKAPSLATKPKPNIIYILADDLGYGDLSCYGQTRFTTPNIDTLAKQGMRFTQHYAGNTVCAPSRCSLLTGLHTGHGQIRGNREIQPVGQHPIDADTFTVFKMLKTAGYKTGMFGKWGLGFPGSEGDPMNQGLDRFFGYNCQRNAHTYYPSFIFDNKKKIDLDGKTYSHDLIMEKANDFIRTNADAPFVCFITIAIPHASMHAPADAHEKWRKVFPQFDDKIGTYTVGPDVTNPIAAFAAMVTHLDDQVGDLMKLLNNLNIDDNTIVIFTSDNGPHREGGHDPDFFNSNSELRGYKRDLYEGGIRVPMIVRWPGHIAAGTTTDHISAFWDVLPTFAEIAGANAPKSIDGISFLPALLGKTPKQKQHEYLYWEFYEVGGKQAVRKGNYKAVKLDVKKNRNAPLELYNLKTDLGEKNNIAKQHPDIVKEMENIMDEAHTPSEIFKW